MIEEEDVAINHYMVLDRPYIYKCRCGYVQSIFPIGDNISTHIYKRPTTKVEYLPCGHAICAQLENNKCAICESGG